MSRGAQLGWNGKAPFPFEVESARSDASLADRLRKPKPIGFPLIANTIIAEIHIINTM